MRAEEVMEQAATTGELTTLFRREVAAAGGVLREAGSHTQPARRFLCGVMGAAGAEEIGPAPIQCGDDFAGTPEPTRARRSYRGDRGADFALEQVQGAVVGEMPQGEYFLAEGAGETEGKEFLFSLSRIGAAWHYSVGKRGGGMLPFGPNMALRGYSLITGIWGDEEKVLLDAGGWVRVFKLRGGEFEMVGPDGLLAVGPKVVHWGMQLDYLAQAVHEHGLPMARMVSATFNEMVNAAREARGDVEGAVREYERPGRAARGAPPDLYYDHTRRAPDLDALPQRGARRDMLELQGRIGRRRQELREWVRRLESARVRAAATQGRMEQLQQAVREGALRGARVDGYGIHAMLPPLLFREDVEREYEGERYPAGLYRMPDAWLYIPHGHGGNAVRVLLPSGVCHPHPGAQNGPDYGMLCWGEGEGASSRHEQQAMELWDTSLPRFFEFLWGYLNNVYTDGTTRYYPLVSFSQRVGD